MGVKTTLELYRTYKDIIDTVCLYDNVTGSSLLFQPRAGALQTFAYRRTFDSAVLSVLCHACGSAEETIAHIVLECSQIGLPGMELLDTARGFAGEDGVNNPQAVKETMWRLEHWRAVVVSQRAKALGGAVQ
ncbi:hypothetical protein HPB51_021703 [Rhipicephalus microplus]|uniref:Tick transposon n=1 Tax=Rhipicephalus microplus TaxID=6941 RepID=A0A9J6D753_RHIMP|nr:hypothetical protein HPB51_021703 [Rhipicephalus microplus]